MTAPLGPIDPEALLDRPPVRFDAAALRSKTAGRRILVTGAGGSIGGEICRQVARHAPARLVMLDLDENQPYLLQRQLERERPQVELEVEVADVRDEGRIGRIFRRHRIDDVFHAAAHKHVPLMEAAPEQAVLNNVGGCRTVAEAAGGAGARRFVLVSTDKAVEPTSVMGASKRVAELLVADLAQRFETRFTSVRFGNVLGSAGSVVPLFAEQIARGGPVTVTDPRCRRYLMTPGEAVGLLLVASLSDLGDLCVLEMGEPIPIVDLARSMIRIAGREPDRDVEIVFTGLRPGEKLDEKLMSDAEAARSRLAAERIRSVDVTPPAARTREAIAALEDLARSGDRDGVIRALERLLPDYTPSSVWTAGRSRDAAGRSP